MRRDAAAAATPPRCRDPATMPRPSRRPFSSQFVLLGAVLDSRLLLQWGEMDRLAGLPPPEQACALYPHAHPPPPPTSAARAGAQRDGVGDAARLGAADTLASGAPARGAPGARGPGREARRVAAPGQSHPRGHIRFRGRNGGILAIADRRARRTPSPRAPQQQDLSTLSKRLSRARCCCAFSRDTIALAVFGNKCGDLSAATRWAPRWRIRASAACTARRAHSARTHAPPSTGAASLSFTRAARAPRRGQPPAALI